jgi:hypothetical protein
MKWDTLEVNGTAMGVLNGIKQTPGSLTQGVFTYTAGTLAYHESRNPPCLNVRVAVAGPNPVTPTNNNHYLVLPVQLYAVPGNPSEVHQKSTTEASQLRAADFPCRA